MTSRDFCYWLQGYFEINGAEPIDDGGLSQPQVGMIKRHLALVFKHEIDPSIPDPTGELQSIHDGPLKPTLAPNTIGSDVTYRC